MKAYIFNKSITLLLLRALAILSQTICIFKVANLIELNSMGIFSLLLGIFTTVKVLGCLGVDVYLIKNLSAQYDLKNQNFSINTSGLIITVSFSFFLFFIIYPIFDYFIVKNYIHILFAYIFTASLIGYFTSLLRGYSKTLTAFMPDLLVINIIFLLIIFNIYNFFEITLNIIIYSHLFSIIIGIIIYLIAIYKFKIKFLTKITKNEIFDIIKESKNFFFNTSLVSIYIKIPIFISPILYSTSFTAIIDLAMRISSVPILLTNSLGSLLSNYFSKYFYDKNYELLKKYLLISSIISSICSIISFLLLLFLGKFLINFFLPGPTEQIYLLTIIFSGMYIVHCSLGLSSNFLLMTNEEKKLSLFSLFQIITLLLITLLLNNTLNEYSLITGVVISMLIKDIACFLFTLNKLKSIN